MPGRFAPTPSGRMHIGNAYAMLGAWLDSRSRQDQIYLRIEDIDQPRVLKDADRWIMDDLDWLGLDWDGEPVYQSARQDLYERALALLKEEPSVLYPCFCSRADIRAASAPQEGDGFFVYPGTCRELFSRARTESYERVAKGERHSWRLAVPQAGHTGSVVVFDDLVYGPQEREIAREVGDVVMLRSDGIVSYHLAVVVDDLEMGVDRVVRGRDLLPSTGLQIDLRQELVNRGMGNNVEPASHPRYAHLPLVDNAAGRRLAKRERSLDLGHLRACGVRAEQVVGYCAYLLKQVSEPCAMSARELLGVFDWRKLQKNSDDSRVPDDIVPLLLES